MATWESAQAALSRRGHAVTRPSYEESPFLLTGLVKCSSCGERMAGHSSAKKNPDGSVKKIYRRYMCQGFTKGGPRHPAVKAELLEGTVIDRIADLTNAPEVLERARKEVLLDRMRSNTTAARDFDALRAELDECHRKQDVLYQDRLEGRVSTGQWERFNADLLARDEEIERRIASEERALLSSGDSPADVSAVLEALRDFRRVFASLENLDRKNVLREVVAEVRPAQRVEETEVDLRSPWGQILGQQSEPAPKALRRRAT